MPIWEIRSEESARAAATDGPCRWAELKRWQWGSEIGAIVVVASALGLLCFFRELRGRGRWPVRLVLAIATAGIVDAVTWLRIPVSAIWCPDHGWPDPGRTLRWVSWHDAWAGFGSAESGQWEYLWCWPMQLVEQILALTVGASLIALAVQHARDRAGWPLGGRRN